MPLGHQPLMSFMMAGSRPDASSDTSEQHVMALVRDTQDTAILGGLLLVTFGASVGSGFAGSSYLLGAFAAGMAFSQVKENPASADASSRAEALWTGRYAVLAWWLAAISFATLGFSIPARDLFSTEGFGLGLLYTVPAFLGKFCLGSFVPSKDGKCGGGGFVGNLDDALVVGWAMVARGELGFVMAQTSRNDGLMDDTTYAACVWALFLCTLMPPLFFGQSVRR